MNCEEFDEVARDLARMSTEEASRHSAAMAHLQSCTPCRQDYAAQKALSRSLAELREGLQSVEAPAGLESALQRAFRERVPMGLQHEHSRDRKDLRTHIFAELGRNLSRENPRRDREGAVAPPTVPASRWYKPALAASLLLAIGLAVLLSVPGNPPPSVELPGAQVSALPENVNEFLPLQYAEPLQPWEHGSVIRVKLPGAALVYLGMPIDARTAVRSFEADVLLGDDGTARAVRFAESPVKPW